MEHITVGEKAYQLYCQIAGDAGVPVRYMLPKILIREGEASAAALPADRLKERIALIEEVREELSRLMWTSEGKQAGTPRQMYTRIWAFKKYLRSQGWNEDQIHYKTLAKYGVDIEMKRQPQKNNNPTGRKGKVE